MHDFAAAMKDTNIQPFSAKAVKKYKSRMARRATPLRTRVLAGAVEVISYIWSLCVLGVGAWLLAGLVCLCLPAITLPGWALATGYSSLAVGIIILICSAPFIDREVVYAEWHTIPIDEYPRPIPEYVLQTAVDLKKKCPATEFFIEVLQFQRRELDPFMVARDPNGNTHYLEVWDEPDFNKKRCC